MMSEDTAMPSSLKREDEDKGEVFQLVDALKKGNYFTVQGIFNKKLTQQIAQADPKNIQEVAASQLSIINNYYIVGLQQSQQSFRWSLIWGGIGLSFLIAAVCFLLLRQPTEVSFTSTIGGAIIEVFAGSYLYLYRRASDQLAAFRFSLEKTQQFLLANSMCESLEGDLAQTTRAELIQAMINMAVNGQPTEKPPTQTKGSHFYK